MIKFYFTNIQKYTFCIMCLLMYFYIYTVCYFHDKERVFLQFLCHKCAKKDKLKSGYKAQWFDYFMHVYQILILCDFGAS